MQKNIQTVVIKPAGYENNQKKYPVVYLLHGYGGNHTNWIEKMPSLNYYATLYQQLIVCPDGGTSSWYINSPVNAAIRMETFILQELPAFIDSNFRSLADRGHRAITGLSMGGHGALMISLRHPAIFGAAASMSGVLNLEEIFNKYESRQMLGDTLEHRETWNQYSVLKIADTLQSARVKLLFDCGINDAFIKANRNLHNKLLQRKIPHDYIERNGQHNWAYWTNALPYHLLFFHQFFENSSTL